MIVYFNLFGYMQLPSVSYIFFLILAVFKGVKSLILGQFSKENDPSIYFGIPSNDDKL